MLNPITHHTIILSLTCGQKFLMHKIVVHLCIQEKVGANKYGTMDFTAICKRMHAKRIDAGDHAMPCFGILIA